MKTLQQEVADTLHDYLVNEVGDRDLTDQDCTQMAEAVLFAIAQYHKGQPDAPTT